MAAEKYPIGIQTFKEIIKGGYTYVDKTRFVSELVTRGKYYFLSRPRRFGKSLLLSTLQAYFEGSRELFKGLYLDTVDMDWTPAPVLHFDFNSEDFTLETNLEYLLNRLLRGYEDTYGITEKDATIAGRFSELIKKIHFQTGRKVVVLVDEYDKPLLGIEENRELFERNQAMLKGFFGNLKSMDQHIRFALLTGVARFNKVSIFSDLNNLNDISMDNAYADICGWTEVELIANFSQGISRLAEKRGADFDTTLKALRDYYDGYLFAEEGSRLYNPFSVLNALDKIKIDPYWFETGTPTFLAKWVRDNGMDPMDINRQSATKDELITVGFDERDPVPLMFQTGYLTISHYDSISELYDLRFPNREVEIGFFKYLLRCYAPLISRRGSGFELTSFKKDLIRGCPHDFMERLSTLLKAVPGEDHNESTYRAITYLLAVLCGTPAIAEHHGYRGRSDIEVFAGDFIYVFEFKYNRSVEDAIDQIHSRDYAGRYKFDSRTVYLIGANFTERKDKRGLEYEIIRYPD